MLHEIPNTLAISGAILLRPPSTPPYLSSLGNLDIVSYQLATPIEGLVEARLAVCGRPSLSIELLTSGHVSRKLGFLALLSVFEGIDC